MMTIASVGVDHYRIPLPVVLSDSTHGDIAEFELVTVRVRDAAGAAGLGYTYTVGRGGAAVAALIKHDLCSVLLGVESRPCAIVLSNDAVAPVASKSAGKSRSERTELLPEGESGARCRNLVTNREKWAKRYGWGRILLRLR